MPIKCPACIPEPNACKGCRFNTDEKCRWTGTPIPIRDILTHEERIYILEEAFVEVLASLSLNIPSNAFSALRKSMDQIKGQVLHLEGKLNEHLDRPKKERKKTKEEGISLGKS